MRVQMKHLPAACFFRAAFPRMVYENNARTDEQETTETGVPLWSVKVEMAQEGAAEEIIVVVPCPRNPAEGLQLNEEIAFAGLTIVSGARRSGGRWERLEADKVVRKKRSE